ncbi:MAG: glycosyltransferase family 39 protein [Polyangiaceae bacterium]|nr:glycosyltransferase family 39 protein [Polyangiaceae bacterium]
MEDSTEASAVEQEPLVPRGNPPRWRAGLAIVAGGLLLGFANLVATYGSRTGVAVGLLATAVVTFGVLWTLGSFHDESDAPPLPLRQLLPGIATTVVAALATFFTLRLAVAGYLGPYTAGALMPLGFLGTVSGVGMTLGTLGVFADDRPFYRREGFWLIAIATIVLLPSLGSHSLVDPWETHYGEVAREVLARKDWISLWWVNEEWFWSKPILTFWMQALGMATLGVRYEAGGMLEAARSGLVPWPEWAVRFPFFLVTVGATYVLYKAVARTFGRRAGLLAGVALTTMPQWFLLSQQTMTDMPFVAGLSAALGFFLLGAHTPGEDRIVPRVVSVGSRRLSVSAHQLVLGAICVIVVPQVLYLLTRNFAVNVDPVFGVRVPPIAWTTDTFMFGSADNCGVVPGNKPCVRYAAVYPKVQPILQAAVWLFALVVVLYLEWGERRTRRLYFLSAFVCAAIATMGKGPAGIVLPAMAVVGYLVVTGRYRLLLDLEIAAGSTAFAAIALPWFSAMWIRHGWPFVDRLIFYDMYKRAFDHVHDTNKSDDVSFRYYVWQLGYATFPWVAWIPPALAFPLRADDAADDTSEQDADRRGVLALLVVWFVGSFALFSYMQTKFHHYIFPVVPALGMLVGIAADRALAARAATGADTHERRVTTVLGIAGALLVLLVARDMAVAREDQPSDARLIQLFTYLYERTWPANVSFSGWIWALAILSAIPLVALGIDKLRRGAVAAFAASAAACALWGLTVYMPTAAPHWGQRELVLRYMTESEAAPGPLVAYQMNWKGENFYTGNRVANFKETGDTFRSWLNKMKKDGQRTFYVLALPGRIRSLESELGATKELTRLTTPEQNNKFVLYRARF